MKEIKSSGTKEFIFTLLWAIFLLMIGRALINALPSYKIVGAAATIIMYCILGFFVLTRYSSRFTYENTGYSLRINRMIGKRNKEVEFNFTDIETISMTKPKKLPKEVFYMRVNVFSDKGSCWITFKRGGESYCVVTEPTDNFIKTLKKSMKTYKKELKNG